MRDHRQAPAEADTDVRTAPTALVLCADARMFRFFEIELAHLGLSAIAEPGAARTVCLAVVDTDTYPLDALRSAQLPADCPVVAYGHTAVELPVGAGIYLRRPFALPALESALRSLTAGASTTAAPLAVPTATRSAAEAAPAIALPEATSDRITVGGQPLTLTPAEAAILRRLHERRGTVVGREELSSLLGGGGNSVEVYICHLRTKIEKPLGRRMIRTVRGQGYVLE